MSRKKPGTRGRPRKRGGGAAARGRRNNKPENVGRAGRRAVTYRYTEEDRANAWREFHR